MPLFDPTFYGPAFMFTLDPQLAADTILLGDSPLCKILLMNDAQFPWVILVPMRNSITEIYHLNKADQAQLHEESIALSSLLMTHFNGDKLNVAAIGNIVSQLHIHHIVRFNDDPVWPKPVWGNISALPYSSEQLEKMSSELNALFITELAGFNPHQH